MRMLVDYPALFAAAFPVCQAFHDRNISDDQIRKLAKEHIWFVHAASDGIVSPEETSSAAYRRLIYQGAKDVHYHYFYDLPPYYTIGHTTWIPTLNGEVHLDYQGYEVKINGKPVDLYEWMAHQSVGQ